MYAAAAARQCEASRQARKKQAQEHLRNKVNQQLAKEKSVAKVKGLSTPTKSKPFHQLPASYLRAPHTHTHAHGGRKLSVNYTTQSKLCLPTSDHAAHQQSFHHNLPRTPTGNRELRLDVCQKLTKSATATFPLASHYHDGSPPQTPTLCYSKGQTYKHSQQNLLSTQPIQLQIPTPGDHIIITPATPIPSPLAQSRQNLHKQEQDDYAVDSSEDTPLERKCSVYRNKKLGAHDENFYKSTTINIGDSDEYNLQQQPYYPGLPNGGHHPHWADEYCDSEHRTLGVCTCDHIECAQGRAAWLERGRRCSVQDANQASYHRRWVKRNRIQDLSLGGSSDDEDLLGVIRGPSSFANAFLYIGLGTASIGLVIAFVGTGEKGFKTNELRLIGPALIVVGLVFCILRILFCICPSHCISKQERNKKSAKVDADHRTSLLRGDSTKRVSIARGPYINSKIPLSSSQSSQFPPKSIVKNKSYEGVEALRQIATTSLFLQNEQKTNTLQVPTINEPDSPLIQEPPMELKKIDTLKVDTLNVIDIVSLTDEETDREIHQIDINQEIIIPKIEPSSLFSDVEEEDHVDSQEEQQRQTNNKLNRQRTSINQSKHKDVDTLFMETSLMIIDPIPSPPPFSPPPLTPTEPSPKPPLSPNVVTTNIPSTLSLTLPLTSTVNSPMKYPNEPHQRHQHHRHHRVHHEHHHTHHSHHHTRSVDAGTSQKALLQQSQQPNQPSESEIVLSPAKLGQQ